MVKELGYGKSMVVPHFNFIIPLQKFMKKFNKVTLMKDVLLNFIIEMILFTK